MYPSSRLNFVDNVSRLKLDVERIVHIPGGSSPYGGAGLGWTLPFDELVETAVGGVT